MLRAVNRHHKVPYHQYGGRGTVFGNPYQHGTRDENCDDYQVYFENELLNPASEISRAVAKLIAVCKDREFVIACSCKPRRCHLDTWVNHVNKAIDPTSESVSNPLEKPNKDFIVWDTVLVAEASSIQRSKRLRHISKLVKDMGLI